MVSVGSRDEGKIGDRSRGTEKMRETQQRNDRGCEGLKKLRERSTDLGMSFHAEVSDALDDRGARIVDAVKHRLCIFVLRLQLA